MRTYLRAKIKQKVEITCSQDIALLALAELAHAYVSICIRIRQHIRIRIRIRQHTSDLLAFVELADAVLMYALTLIVVQCLYQRRRP